MSLGMRMLNLFVAPTELFDYLAKAPVGVSNWLLPLFLNSLFIIAFSFISFSNPSVTQEMHDLQVKAIDQQVASGKMPADRREPTLEAIDKMRPFMAVFGAVGGVIFIGFFTFLTAAFVWLIAVKILGATLEIGKALEISGLAGLVSLPGTCVKLALVMLKGSINVGVNPGLLMSNIAPGSPLATVMNGLDLFVLWNVLLLSLAISRATRRSFGAVLPWLVGLWLGIVAILTGITALSYSK